MISIENITNEANQIIPIELVDFQITLNLYFVLNDWYVNITYNDTNIYGIRLSIATTHIESSNLPFDLWVEDINSINNKTDLAVDPFNINDFYLGRTKLFIMERADIEAYRGTTLPL